MEEKILNALVGLNRRFDKLEDRFDKLEGRFDKLEGRFDSLEIQVRENTQILKALEHSAQVNKAEHDKMNIEMAKFNGTLKSVQNALSAVEKVTANNWSEIVELKAAKAV